MTRSARLLDLIQALRARRRPVTAAALAAELGVTPRTIYRDVATLVGQGAPIDGEAGVGYVLRPGFLMPPLMFESEEVEALVLGLRLVERRTDPALSEASRRALVRILAVLPPDLREWADHSGLLAGPMLAQAGGVADLGRIRMALRQETKLALHYVNADGGASERVVWPVALAFFEQVRVLVAWCELRQDFRTFRTDRIERMAETGLRYPRARRMLLADWRRREQLDD
jgi:predicted DNA-binding transcriptional regulator YafY